MALLVAALGLVPGVGPASAEERLAIDQDQILFGESGSVTTLAETEVEAGRIGSRCTLRVHAENQFSVHPGNDLLITSGGTTTVIEDVEAAPDMDRDLSAEIVLGPTLVVELRFGPDEVSSMGYEVRVDCATAASGSVERAPATPDLPSEASLPPTTVPDPCPGQGDGSLTLGPGGCPEPTVLPTVVENTTTSTTTTTAPPPSSTVPPASTTSSTASSATSPPASASGPTPTVLGLQIERGLPQTPAAQAVPAAPDYTG